MYQNRQIPEALFLNRSPSGDRSLCNEWSQPRVRQASGLKANRINWQIFALSFLGKGNKFARTKMNVKKFAFFLTDMWQSSPNWDHSLQARDSKCKIFDGERNSLENERSLSVERFKNRAPVCTKKTSETLFFMRLKIKHYQSWKRIPISNSKQERYLLNSQFLNTPQHCSMNNENDTFMFVLYTSLIHKLYI